MRRGGLLLADMPRSPRLAVRALILREDRLLVVNAYPDGQSDLWCAPGGGVHAGTALPDNLIREVHEETGLAITVGDPALVNEFHDPATGFHQVEIFFRCTVPAGDIDHRWTDPEGVVTRRRWVTQAELGLLRHKPGSLGPAAWGTGGGSGLLYDPLEVIVR
jgi:ADP-ribose pyrophosphatase YjhB (NUDIX family)